MLGLLPWVAAWLATACSSLPVDYPKTVSTAFEAPASTQVGGLFEREAARHPGRSGFVLVPGNREAFTDRVALADFAEKTLDVQYFIWSRDTIGSLLGEHLVAAADRGVRVRFLVDDVNFKKRDGAVAALSAHPNVEIRIFNPHRYRSARVFEFVANFGRLNKRMHNKIMVMDNACAIVGGRNIADEYFGLSRDYNNRDLDLVAVGPIVRDISATFDEFWNSEASVPIEALVEGTRDLDDFRRQVETMKAHARREDYPFPLELDVADLRARLDTVVDNFLWAPARVFHDTFASMREAGGGTTLAEQLHAEIDGAKREVLVESAYFVTRRPGIERARALADRGVRVRVLTNSLASNNVLAAQAGHAKNRDKLLEAGVELHELRPDAAVVLRQVAPHAQGSTTTLHTKALVIDDEKAFVGSYNLDPRSMDINSEIGIFVESPAFARRVRAILDEGVTDANAYRVTLDGRGRLRWETIVDGEPQTWIRDPETTAGKRFKSGLISILPIQGQL